ncbi:MAG TPA: DUF72 domain-containing protein [Oligoflexus sp.]|uniref:DUF72 domain-containing protein n=1 Tax=Oligoflexus sp. TaxID=1971216 RepID=UPI002D8114B6|nr:DUF72 domain-containing protein [Oligoflexus sp.]HET9241714.1 DUF72 domain-containing protein [Oligoflexus sp.]
MKTFFIGTAGWSIPRTATGFFASSGAVLERYASRFKAVEINSSFYRDHGAKTYEKWAAMTPENFHFAVKLSRAYTHSREWNKTDLLHTVDGYLHLGPKLGVILVQLAPRHQFDPEQDRELFATVRRVYDGPMVVEPRHRSWASHEAHLLMHEMKVGKVNADPERCPDLKPEFESPISYYRLHGSPEIYASDYAYHDLQQLGEKLQAEKAGGQDSWVIFDNTKFGRATHNALELVNILESPGLESAGDIR